MGRANRPDVRATRGVGSVSPGRSHTERMLNLPSYLRTARAEPPEPEELPKKKVRKGPAYTSLSFNCKRGQHKQCYAKKCQCECGHTPL
jgi:hypothetical protein